MKIRIRSLFILLCIFLSGGLLLHTSQKVQDSENALKELEQKITQEEETIKVLKTEWAFLNNPERLERLAQKYLDVKAVTPEQMANSSSSYFQDRALAEAVSPETPTALPTAYEMPAQKPTAKPEKDFSQLLQQISDEAPR